MVQTESPVVGLGGTLASLVVADVVVADVVVAALVHIGVAVVARLADADRPDFRFV